MHIVSDGINDPGDISEKITDLRDKFEKDVAEMITWVPMNIEEKVKDLRENYEKDLIRLRKMDTRVEL